jgi:hypothetical protein
MMVTNVWEAHTASIFRVLNTLYNLGLAKVRYLNHEKLGLMILPLVLHGHRTWPFVLR